MQQVFKKHIFRSSSSIEETIREGIDRSMYPCIAYFHIECNVDNLSYTFVITVDTLEKARIKIDPYLKHEYDRSGCEI